MYPWLIEPYSTMFKNLKNNVIPKFNELDKELFTLHDATHCENVEKMAKAILAKSKLEPPLSSVERFLVSAACWTHDLGMNQGIATDYFANVRSSECRDGILKDRRKEHHRISCWYLLKDKNGNIFKRSPSDVLEVKHHITKFMRAIAIIIQYHRKVEDIRSCKFTRTIKGEMVRIQLLAALLRLADTLHIDSTRIDPNLYAMLQIASYDRASRLHWLKSFFVSNVHFDENSQKITINLDLPIPSLFTKNSDEYRDWGDRVKNLEYIISSEIESELLILNEIFSANRMPTYVKVFIDTVEIPGFSKHEYTELKGLLSELDILFSPNTSKVISRSLESVKTFSQTKFDTPELFKTQYLQLKNYLNEIHRYRPCHAGLGKIIDLLEKLNDDLEVDDKKAKLVQFVEEIKKERKLARKEVCQYSSDIVGDGTKYIFVVGYSSTIVDVLEEYSKIKSPSRKSPQLFVLECAPKRRFSANNQMEYNDGIQYACELSKLGCYDIHLIPDGGFPTVVNVLISKEKPDKGFHSTAILLIGANGIGSIREGQSGDIDVSKLACGHSSGHLSAVIIARNYSIPIKLVADFFKVGYIKWEPTAIRDVPWLTSQERHVEELRRNSIALPNYREDKIPIDLIDEIYTDVGCLKPKDKPAFGKKYRELQNKSGRVYDELESLLSKSTGNG